MSNEFTDFEISNLGLEGVDTWGGEKRPLCAPGLYKLRVVACEQKTAKSSQQPMIEVTYEVVEAIAVDEGYEASVAGTRVYNNYSLSAKALGRLKAFMIACGMQLDKFVGSQALGSEIQAQVIHTQGQPSTDQNGNVREAGTFANVINETALNAAPAQQPAATTPPIMNKGNAKPANNTAARRA